MTERLDKLIASQGKLSRSDVKKMVKSSRVTVDGAVVKSADIKVDADKSVISVDGKALNYKKNIYIMLNKPQGVISASNDKTQKTVVDLVPPELYRDGLFPAGRLDGDTVGFVLITDDGDFAHRILSPKNHIMKTYHATLRSPLTEEDISAFKNGIELSDGTLCLEAEVRMLEKTDEPIAEVKICEGK
ncbi:MAG: rRNA pseudouridine synthase, partial [Clostridia bacterium]|nr:rRNA pseudouridine synthase [Clostridia bacterium]